jgi:hypothetical protein
MSKAARLREQSARQKIAAQQAAAKRAEQRRRAIILGGSVVAVIAIVVVFIIFATMKKTPSTTASGGVHGTVLPASVSANVTGVPAATLDQVGAGSVMSYQNSTFSGPPVVPISGSPPLVSGGKPEMLYIGAEFCPFCGAMRWSMAVALSRFGHFTTPLAGFHSSPTDTDPSTPTLTFYKAGYTSPYLTFTPVENEDVNRNPLQSLTSDQQSLWTKYDSSGGYTDYPFLDFGNKYAIKAPLYDPAILKGMSWAQVAAAMHDPSSPQAKAILGTANYITAAICRITNNTPSSVCSSAAVTSVQSTF